MVDPLACDCEFAAIDFESAGAAPGMTDSPVQVGIALLGRDGINPTQFYRRFLDPGRPVTWAARKTHGISDSEIAGAPRLLTLWPDVKRLLGGRVVVAHGIGTEQRFLRVFPGHGFGPWVDSIRLARAISPGLQAYALEEVVTAAGVEDRLRQLCPELTWHDALYDAVGCLLVVEFVLREFNRDGTLPLRALLEPDTLAYYASRKRAAS